MEIGNTLFDMAIYYDVEWVISDMGIKMDEVKIKNPNYDLADAQKKVFVLKRAQTYIHECADEIRIQRKRNFDLELIVQMKLKEIDELKKKIEMRELL